MDWIQIASNLPVGQKTRTQCCGSDDSLLISHNPKDYRAFCFRCDRNDYHDKGQLTLGELRRIKELNELALTTVFKVELPDDFTTEPDLTGRLWLYRGGIGPSTWRNFGVGYSESMQRTIIPIYDKTGALIWWQARATHPKQTPKYLQPSGDKADILFHGRQSGRYEQSYDRIVVVEDMLSAIRVGEVEESVSLLGVKLSTGQAEYLSRYREVIVWLDPDRAGRVGTRNIKRTLDLVTEVRSVRSSVDPKNLTRQQIKEILR